MPKFRKKPVEIEARQWFGGDSEMHVLLTKELLKWMNAEELESAGVDVFINPDTQEITGMDLYINTLEGQMQVSPRDWIIKGVKGEFYPCKPDIFEATYEEVE